MRQDEARAVAVIGGGPAGLMAAETLAEAGLAVTVYDRMPSLGRKFLMAGRGGLNLTHTEPMDRFLARYGAAEPVRAAVRDFPPAALIAWCEGLGQTVFVGSSGRVFPVAFKASPLLRAWLARLRSLGVTVALRHRFEGWDEAGALRLTTPDGTLALKPDATLLALGGASWPRLGSDGAWQTPLAARGIALRPFLPANCGFQVTWSDVFRERFAGTPLKRIALRVEGESVRGEATIAAQGIEGGAVYALSARLRETILRDGRALLHLDLRPDLSVATLAEKLAQPRAKQSLSTFLRKQGALAPVAIALLREAFADLATADAETLALRIKSSPLMLEAPFAIARAISSAGGVVLDDLDDGLMLRAEPGLFVAGEMLDWDAPTGGYLLQASLAMGRAAATGLIAWLGRHARADPPPKSE